MSQLWGKGEFVFHKLNPGEEWFERLEAFAKVFFFPFYVEADHWEDILRAQGWPTFNAKLLGYQTRTSPFNITSWNVMNTYLFNNQRQGVQNKEAHNLLLIPSVEQLIPPKMPSFPCIWTQRWRETERMKEKYKEPRGEMVDRARIHKTRKKCPAFLNPFISAVCFAFILQLSPFSFRISSTSVWSFPSVSLLFL